MIIIQNVFLFQNVTVVHMDQTVQSVTKMDTVHVWVISKARNVASAKMDSTCTLNV